MATIKEIRARMKGVGDTQKITNAMYWVASTKLTRAKRELAQTRPYFDALTTEISRLALAIPRKKSRYFRVSEGGVPACLAVTADKGLAGAYNQSVIQKALAFLHSNPGGKLYVVGEYGRHYFQKRHIPIEQSFLYTAQNPSMDRAREIHAVLLEAFDQGKLASIHMLYSDGEEGLAPKTVMTQLLPFPAGENTAESEGETPEFFPSADAVLDTFVRCCLSGFIYSALVASFCAEQSARMAAMGAANQNAEKILETLTLLYNQERQAAITREITEISSGAKAQLKKRSKEVLPR